MISLITTSFTLWALAIMPWWGMIMDSTHDPFPQITEPHGGGGLFHSIFIPSSNSYYLRGRENAVDRSHQYYHHDMEHNNSRFHRRSLQASYPVSLHIFLPTVLPLLDDRSKNVFEHVALQFILFENNNNETFPILSIENLQITNQEMTWSRIFNGIRTPGIEVFFRADVHIVVDIPDEGISQQATEQSLQSLFDDESARFYEAFNAARGGTLFGLSSLDATTPSSGTSTSTSTPPPSTEPPDSFTVVVPTSPSSVAGLLDSSSANPTKPSTPTKRPTLLAEQAVDTTVMVSRKFSNALTVEAITGYVVASGCFLGLLLLWRYIQRYENNHHRYEEKASLEITLQTDDNKEEHDDSRSNSEASFMRDDNSIFQVLHHSFQVPLSDDDAEELLDNDDCGVSDEEDESHHSLFNDELSITAIDRIDPRVFFECDESVVLSSHASSSANSCSDCSINGSVITVEDLDNFDKELLQVLK